MCCPLSPYISCNTPHFFCDIPMHQRRAKNSFGCYIRLRMTGTSEITPKNFRKYSFFFVTIWKKPTIVNIFFSPLINT